MSAARTLAALAAAGAALRVDGPRLVLVGPRTLPPGLRAEVRAAAAALLRVASGRWRLDLAAWPLWRLDLFEERAALMAEGGVAPELVEQLAYLDTAEQPEPPPDPEPPEGDLEVSSDDSPPAGPLDLAGAEHLPAGAPVPNVPTIAKEDGPPIAKVDSTEAPGAQLDGPEAPRADRLPLQPPLATPSGPPPALILSALPPLASPEAVARAIDGTLGALPAVLAPWQRFELGAWGADRRDRWARGVAQARAEGAEEAAAEALAYYRTRPGCPAAPGGALRPVANPSADPFEGPEHDQRDPFEGPATPPAAPPRRLPPLWRWSDVVPMAPQAPRSDRAAPFPHPLDAPPSPRTAPATPAAPGAVPAAVPDGCAA